jgi:hypothetical protein
MFLALTPDDDAAFVARLPVEWREPVAVFLRRLREIEPPDEPFFAFDDGGGFPHFVLDAEGVPFRAPLAHWCAWFEVGQRRGRRGGRHPRRVAYARHGRVEVSTIFCPTPSFGRGLDDAIPTWETMIFGGPLHGARWRYRSRADAVIGHVAVLAVWRFARQAPRRLKIAAERTATDQRVAPRWRRRVRGYLRRVEAYAEMAFAGGPSH